jgi:MFS family permease
MSDAGEAVPATTIAGIALASALVPLNSTMIAVALPEIADEFDISTGHTSVLVTVYLAAMLVGQPVAGRISDRVGARRLALTASAGFGVCSALAMITGTFALLVTLRAAQAVFASALAPSVQAMLREAVPEGDRGRAFGVQGSVLGVGAGLGPVIGGLVTAAFGWRAIFGVNLPIVVAVLYVLGRRVAPSAAAVADAEGSEVPHDARNLLAQPVFRAAFSTQALSTLAQYALLLVVPIVLDDRHWSAASVGAALTCLTVGMVLVGPWGGRLGDIVGRRRPVIGGLAVTVVAVALSALGGDDVPSAVLVLTLLLFGLGLGVATPNLMTAGIESAPLSRVGSAAGLLSASRYVGSITSTLVLAGVVGDDGSGLHTLLLVSGASLVAAVLVARALPGARPAVARLAA